MPAQEPEVITPLFTTTPDKLDGREFVKNKLPPIPTPPVIVKAPDAVDVDTVDEEIITSLVKVFMPAKDCARVDTRPVAPVPAIGILNVCVAPEEEILNPNPELPAEKYCVLSVKPLIVDMAEAAAAPQVKPVDDDVSTLRTKLFVPRGNFIKVDPAPTSMSPKA